MKTLPPFLLRFDRLIALLLGATATLGFAPFSFWPLSVLALAALFALCASQAWKRAMLLGWMFGVGHFGTGVYWVFVSTHVYGGAPFWLGIGLAAVLFGLLAVYPALVCGVASATRTWRSPLGWLVVPSLWVLSELLRGWIYSGFPWLSLGYIGLDTPAQGLGPVLGVHGLSLLFALSAYALHRGIGAVGVMRPATLAVALLPLAGALLPAPGTWTTDAGPPLRVAIVQGNVPQDEKWDRGHSAEILERYRAMTLAAGAELVAWPEVVPNRPLDLLGDYFDELDVQARGEGTALLAGVLIRGPNETIFNSIMAVGTSQGRYDKRHLVPFGEYFPIPAWLRPIMDVLGTPYSDFSSNGPRRDPIRVKGQRIGISICFEDVFGAEFARESRDASLLVNATNDAWFAHTSAPSQHLDISRFRALENGRWFVRATNTGISALIGPDGRVVARSRQYETELMRGEVMPRAGLTPYARWRDAPLWALGVVGLFASLVSRVRKYMKKAM